jgi:hypothetical protein
LNSRSSIFSTNCGKFHPVLFQNQDLLWQSQPNLQIFKLGLDFIITFYPFFLGTKLLQESSAILGLSQNSGAAVFSSSLAISSSFYQSEISV